MKQYCRYCCYLVVGDAVWCRKRQQEMSEAVAKSPNRCHSFAFNPLDAFASVDKSGEIHQYTPRIPTKKQCDGQISMNLAEMR